MPRPRPQANPAQDLMERLKAQSGRRPPMTAADALSPFAVSTVDLSPEAAARAQPTPRPMTPEGLARELRLDGPAARAFVSAARPVLASRDLAGIEALVSLAVRLGARDDVARAAVRRAAIGAASQAPDALAALVSGALQGTPSREGWLYRSSAKRSGSVPQSVRDNARRGLEYRRKQGADKAGLTAQEAGKQGIGSGVVRATQLANGGPVSLRVLRQMRNFFSRHAKNKAVAPEHQGEPWNDNGFVSWLLWGGDDGRAWANREIERLEGEMQKGQKVVATGKRGGKIVGYKDDGSPIYGKDEPDAERTADGDAEPELSPEPEAEPDRPTPEVDSDPLSEEGPPLDESAVGDPSASSDDDDGAAYDKMHRDLGAAFDKLDAVEKLLSAEMIPVFNQLKSDMRAMAERIDSQSRAWRGAGAGSRGVRGTRTALDDLLAMVGAFIRFASTVGKRAVEAADRRLKGDKATNRDALTKAVASYLQTDRLVKGTRGVGHAAWFLRRLADLDAAPVVQLDECEIPDALGRLIKGRTHKYIRRVPKPGGGYRYYYRTSGVTRDVAPDLKPGAKFKLEHNGEAGHFEVIGASGGRVRLRHDESGGEMVVSAAALSDLLRREHAEVVQSRRERLKRDIAAAKKHGTAKQVARLEAEAKRHGFDVGGESAAVKALQSIVAANSDREPFEQRQAIYNAVRSGGLPDLSPALRTALLSVPMLGTGHGTPDLNFAYNQSGGAEYLKLAQLVAEGRGSAAPSQIMDWVKDNKTDVLAVLNERLHPATTERDSLTADEQRQREAVTKSYRPDAPPADLVKRIRARYPKATDKDVRAFIHTFNSVFEATGGDEKAKDAAAFPAAWPMLGKRMSRKGRADALRKALQQEAPRRKSAIVLEALRELDAPPSPNRMRHPYVGRMSLPGGLTVNVENARGMVRRGRDSDGNTWAVQMPAHYGEIDGTLGADGDPIDVFVGPAVETAPAVFLVALRDPKSGHYDEDKVFIGFPTKAEALATYRAAYDRADLGLECRRMAYPEFLAWLERHGSHGRRIDAGRVMRLRKALGHRGPALPREERLRAGLRRGMVRVKGRLRADVRLDAPTLSARRR